MHLTLANATLQLTFLVSHFLSFLSVCAWNYKKKYEPLITTLEKPLHEHKYKRQNNNTQRKKCDQKCEISHFFFRVRTSLSKILSFTSSWYNQSDIIFKNRKFAMDCTILVDPSQIWWIGSFLMGFLPYYTLKTDTLHI